MAQAKALLPARPDPKAIHLAVGDFAVLRSQVERIYRLYRGQGAFSVPGERSVSGRIVAEGGTDGRQALRRQAAVLEQLLSLRE
jgi:hypothetical protein